MRNTLSLTALAIMLPSLVLGGVRCYQVEPCNNCNGWTRAYPYNYIDQIFVQTSDSLNWAEAFVGFPNGIGHKYEFDVTQQGGNQILYQGFADDSGRGWRYIHAVLDDTFHVALPPKGTMLNLRITAQTRTDSINYYASAPPTSPSCSLALRIEGANASISPGLFAVDGWNWDSRVFATARAVGARWVREPVDWAGIEAQPGSFNWSGLDAHVDSAVRLGVHLLPKLGSWPDWASTHQDTNVDTIVHIHVDTIGQSIDTTYDTTLATTVTWDGACPPRGMDITPTACDTTYAFQRFIYRFFQRYCPGGAYWDSYPGGQGVGDTYGITYAEIENEPNDLAGSWKYAERTFYSTIDTGYDSSSMADRQVRLYAICCDNACLAAGAAYSSAQVMIGATGGVLMYSPNHIPWPPWLIPGVSWIGSCYGYSSQRPLIGGVTIHPYEYPNPTGGGEDNEYAVKGDTFLHHVDTVRTIMRDWAQEAKPLWATEIGWGPDNTDTTRLRAATSLPEAYMLGIAGSSASRGLGRMFWEIASGGGSALTDPQFEPEPCYFAYSQMVNELSGKRLNGRILSGDTAIDKHSFVYELESTATGTKTWVGWRTWADSTYPTPSVYQIPVRSNALDTVCLARDENPSSGQKVNSDFGWFQKTLGRDPIYIREQDSVACPDLALDSVWTDPVSPYSGESAFIYARLSDSVVNTPYETLRVSFYVSGFYVGSWDSLLQILRGHSITVRCKEAWHTWIPGDYLIKAAANEARDFVELNWDHNTVYCHRHLSWPALGLCSINPGASSGGVTVTSLPKVVLKAQCCDSLHGWADSVRIGATHWFSATDTSPVTTNGAWVPYESLMVYTLPQGEGRYRISIRALFKDSAYRDTSVVLTDSCCSAWSPVVCSLKIDGNHLFANCGPCSLSLTGSSDGSSGPGLALARFSNTRISDLCQNSAFSSGISGWQANHDIVDTEYGGASLVELLMSPDSSIYLYQTVPTDSFNGLSGDRLRVSVDILSDSLVNQGYLQFGYVYAKADTHVVGPNQICSTAVSVAVPLGYASSTGGNDLSGTFTFSPSPPTGYSFAGGRVGVFFPFPTGNSGKALVDNLRLDIDSGPDYPNTTWQTYATTANWTLSSSSGYKTVYAQVQDKAGNRSAVAAKSIVLDTIPPIAIINFPGPGQVITSSQISVLGAADDPPVGSLSLSHFSWYKLTWRLAAGPGSDTNHGIFCPSRCSTSPSRRTPTTRSTPTRVWHSGIPRFPITGMARISIT